MKQEPFNTGWYYQSGLKMLRTGAKMPHLVTKRD
jgi:hypothetical protein